MDSHNIVEPMSESVEMYLLRIALLQEEDKPVPISVLAEELSVSPVSANQMCRKLEERGVIHYEPYRGVRLTLQGEAAAMRVLRRRRLWEVFLTEKLGVEPQVAEEIACRFEHVTPDSLAERLAGFLGNPTVSPRQQPIPPSIGSAVRRPRSPLSGLAVGVTAQLVEVHGEAPLLAFLRDQGLVPGAEITVLAIATGGSLLVEVDARQIALATEVTRLIDVAPQRLAVTPSVLEDVFGLAPDTVPP
jgi:DtxR family Mn-dependent transcriptional regulator